MALRLGSPPTQIVKPNYFPLTGSWAAEGSILTQFNIKEKLAALAQMVASLLLVQRARGSIPDGVVNFHLKIFNLATRRGGDVHFLIARLYITSLD